MNVGFYVRCLLIALLHSSTAANSELSESDLNAISGRIESLVESGLWRRDTAVGRYRLIVTRIEWADNTSNEFFLQWVRADHTNWREVVDHTERISELSGYCLGAPPLDLATNDNFGHCFSLVASLRGVDDDHTFTITPHPDYTYSISSHFTCFDLSRPFVGWAAFLAGAAVGGLCVYAKFRSRNG